MPGVGVVQAGANSIRQLAHLNIGDGRVLEHLAHR